MQQQRPVKMIFDAEPFICQTMTKWLITIDSFFSSVMAGVTRCHCPPVPVCICPKAASNCQSVLQQIAQVGALAEGTLASPCLLHL
jgi:hypothetical protein